ELTHLLFFPIGRSVSRPGKPRRFGNGSPSETHHHHPHPRRAGERRLPRQRRAGISAPHGLGRQRRHDRSWDSQRPQALPAADPPRPAGKLEAAVCRSAGVSVVLFRRGAAPELGNLQRRVRQHGPRIVRAAGPPLSCPTPGRVYVSPSLVPARATRKRGRAGNATVNSLPLHGPPLATLTCPPCNSVNPRTNGK